MFFILEMANNHQGSVSHAKAIIDDFEQVTKEYDLNVGLKVQFRNLDTFIHPDYKQSDLKYVKRFNETRLEVEDFREILNYAKTKGMKTVATPFDNESLSLFDELDVDILKIASCSSDDWPLLRAVAKVQRKIIFSTAGADIPNLQRVYNLFKSNNRDFAFMHCVADYPTSSKHADLARINVLKENFPDIEIGFSTHESPDEESLAPYASAMGCTIFEKHIGKETDSISLNAYSCTKDQYEEMIKSLLRFQEAYEGKSTTQKEALRNLKRGIYVNKDLTVGHTISEEDLFYAMPCQKGQLDVSQIDSVLGSTVTEEVLTNQSLMESYFNFTMTDQVKPICDAVKNILEKTSVHVTPKDKCEISCHYGIENFENYGAFIIDKVNREYCKKIIVMLPNQKHPEHYHIRKEETFELIHGDCLLLIKGRVIELKPGEPFLIARNVPHAFKTSGGCVIEEISTTHHKGDSIYTDPTILRKSVDERKVKCKLEQ